MVGNPPVKARDIREAGLTPEWGRPPGGGRGNHSGILAWKIPWTEELCMWLQSIDLQTVRHS